MAGLTQKPVLFVDRLASLDLVSNISHFHESISSYIIATKFIVGSVALSRAAFGQSVGAILLDTVSCFGREDSILDCSHGGIGRHKCGHSEDAGVICECMPLLNYCY